MDKDQKHIPFAVIVAATNGDETAIQEILDIKVELTQIV